MRTAGTVSAACLVCLVAVALVIGFLPLDGYGADTIKIGLLEAKSGPFEAVGTLL